MTLKALFEGHAGACVDSRDGPPESFYRPRLGFNGLKNIGELQKRVIFFDTNVLICDLLCSAQRRAR